MSDLISRKAVIDLINKRIENRVPDGNSLYLRNNEAIDIQFAVEELPTAYDVDKAVEELSECQEALKSNLEKEVEEAYKYAIEILKGAVKHEMQ